MAKLERELQGNFDEILNYIEKSVLEGSLSASYEDGSDFGEGDTRCSVRVFERYSMIGGNRLSLSITLFKHQDKIHLSAIAAGGSQGALLKWNTWGEEAFLVTFEEALDGLPKSLPDKYRYE